MSGVTDLKELMMGMSPELESPVEYVFLSLKPFLSYSGEEAEFIKNISLEQAIATFREEEGLTVVIPLSFIKLCLHDETKRAPRAFTEEWKQMFDANGSIKVTTMKRITMKIHSSLTAVGFTAAFSKVLTEANISCNVFASYHHDHIFVPTADAERAMEVLQSTIQQAKNSDSYYHCK